MIKKQISLSLLLLFVCGAFVDAATTREERVKAADQRRMSKAIGPKGGELFKKSATDANKEFNAAVSDVIEKMNIEGLESETLGGIAAHFFKKNDDRGFESAMNSIASSIKQSYGAAGELIIRFTKTNLQVLDNELAEDEEEIPVS